MEKYGVVDGVVKTASADNEGDPVGTAARCINDARKAMSGLSDIVGEIKAGLPAGKDDGKGE